MRPCDVAQLLILSGVLHPESIRYALILCVLRLGRVLTSIERYSVIMSAFFSLWQVVFPVSAPADFLWATGSAALSQDTGYTVPGP